MRVKNLMIKVVDQLRSSEVQHPHRTAKWIFCDVLDCSATHLIAHDDLSIDTSQISQVLRMTERCATHEPIQYVVGYTEFCGLNLNLSPDVLIPRPETEQLVELSISAVKPSDIGHVLDIGTGSGCIALAIKHRKQNANVTGCDISKSALSIAKINAEKLDISLSLIHADVLSQSFVNQVGRGYDLVVSNPPYVPDYERSQLPRMVRDFEPSRALFCGNDPMKYYQAIAYRLHDGLLNERGVLILETHSDYAGLVSDLFEKESQYQVEIRHDLNGMPRFVIINT